MTMHYIHFIQKYLIKTIWFCLMAVLSFLQVACNDQQQKTAEIPTGDTTAIGKALVVINTKIGNDPGNDDNYRLRAKIYLQKGELEKSLADIQKAIAIDSTKAPHYLVLADLQFAANKTQLAKESLEKCISIDPRNKEANMKLAEIYFYVRQYEKAIGFIDGVLKEDVHNAKAYLMKGMTFKEMGDTSKAISSFQTSIEQDQDYYPAYIQLAIIMHARHNPLAVQYYTAAIRLNPSSEEAFYGRGLYYQDHNDLDKAIQDYTTLYQINPKNKQAYFNLGYIHYAYLKVYDQAIKHYSQAIACDSTYAEAFYNRALCYEASGDVFAAKRDYENAINQKPGYEAAIAGLRRVEK